MRRTICGETQCEKTQTCEVKVDAERHDAEERERVSLELMQKINYDVTSTV